MFWNQICKKCHLFIIYKSISGHPDARTSKPQSSQIWICKFVNNKQMAFLQILFHNYCFLFSKHLDTMSIRRIVSPVKQIFALIQHLILLKNRKLFSWKYVPSKCDMGEDTFVYFFHSVYEAMIYHDHMRISIQYTFEGIWRGGSVVFYPIQLLAFRGFFFTPWAKSFTSLKADLLQDINGDFAISRCLP